MEELLQRQINKQADEIAVLRLKIEDLMAENKRLRLERRLLENELALHTTQVSTGLKEK